MRTHRTMMRHAFSHECSGLFAFLIACGSLAVPDTRDADIKAVKNVEAEEVKAVAAKDLDKILIYDADDESKLLPNLPIITGKDNIKAAWKLFLADPNLHSPSSPREPRRRKVAISCTRSAPTR